jgi:hypothetical protein
VLYRGSLERLLKMRTRRARKVKVIMIQRYANLMTKEE